jgi:hypothetical protein
MIRGPKAKEIQERGLKFKEYELRYGNFSETGNFCLECRSTSIWARDMTWVLVFWGWTSTSLWDDLGDKLQGGKQKTVWALRDTTAWFKR